MNSNDFTGELSLAEETMLDKSAMDVPVTAGSKQKLHPLYGEDGGEWEGFYEDGDGWVEL
jgi:hypothetical protein